MTEVESDFFQIVDAFARAQLKCFLAEFFPSSGKDFYTLCFRPVGPQTNTERDYDCCYLKVDASAVSARAYVDDGDAQEELLSGIQKAVKSSPIFK